MKKYILDHANEVERLELQSSHANYHPTFEVSKKDVTLDKGGSFLDAGCGSGIMARFILDHNKNRSINAYAMDRSHERIRLTQSLAVNQSYDVHYVVGDLTRTKLDSQLFDLIVCRFVYEHNPDDIQNITNEMFRLLKPGGTYIVIDTDGLLFNLDCENKLVKSCLELLKKELSLFDAYVCKRIPRCLKRGGFNLHKIKKIPLSFFSLEDRQYEADMWEMRFDQAADAFTKVLGEDMFSLFRKAYVNEILSDENLIYYNKFSFQAKKSKSSESLSL